MNMEKCYFESYQNDLVISSMECDIVLDKLDLVIECYNSDIMMTEATKRAKAVSHTIGDAVRKAILTVIYFIGECITRVQQLFTKVQIKRLENAYNKKLKEDASIKDKTIHFIDKRIIASERDELTRELKKSQKDMVRMKKIRKREESLAYKKLNNAAITLGAAVVMLSPMIDKIIKNMTRRKQELNKYKDEMYARVNDDDTILNRKRRQVFGKNIADDLDDYTHSTDNECGHEYASIMAKMAKASTKDEVDSAYALFKAFMQGLNLKDQELYGELLKKQGQGT